MACSTAVYTKGSLGCGAFLLEIGDWRCAEKGLYILKQDVYSGKHGKQEHAREPDWVAVVCPLAYSAGCAVPMPRVLFVRWWPCLVLLSIALYHVDAFSLIPFSSDISGAIRSRHTRQRHSYTQQHTPTPRSRPRRLGKRLSPAVHEPAAVDITLATRDNALQIDIKPATYFGLRAVSKLLVEEFYGIGLWFPAQRLVELNRLQDNFHSYEEDADRHLMLIATTVEDGSLVGFVDIDGREKKPGQTGCRPYLSDLAVAKRFKRMGAGTELVRACEEACLRWGYDSMYLKVQAGNVAAEKLYENLGYFIHSPKDSKNEVMLCGNITARAEAVASGGVVVVEEG